MNNEMLCDYSHGFNGSVYRLSNPTRSFLSAKADFLKMEEADFAPIAIAYAKHIYYGHKISNLLFPGSVIDIVSAQFKREGGNSVVKTYSKDAHVNPDHAKYSAHMHVIDGEKMSLCGCPQCKRHRQFHAYSVTENAEKLALELDTIGIKLPFTDPSDYCKTEAIKGNFSPITFFEIDAINTLQLEDYLNGLKQRTKSQEEALHLVERYVAINPVTALFSMVVSLLHLHKDT